MRPWLFQLYPQSFKACISVVNHSFDSQKLKSRSRGRERKNDEKESWRQAANFKKVRTMEGGLVLGSAVLGTALTAPPQGAS